jgi:hypothetical protein
MSLMKRCTPSSWGRSGWFSVDAVVPFWPQLMAFLGCTYYWGRIGRRHILRFVCGGSTRDALCSRENSLMVKKV